MKTVYGKRSIAVVLCSLMLVLFAACGSKGSGNDAVAGNWKATKVEMYGVSVSLEDFEETYGTEFEMSMELKKDGSATINSNEESIEGTYEVGENSIDLTFSGETQSVSLNDDMNEITIEYEGIQVVMAKQ